MNIAVSVSGTGASRATSLPSYPVISKCVSPSTRNVTLYCALVSNTGFRTTSSVMVKTWSAPRTVVPSRDHPTNLCSTEPSVVKEVSILTFWLYPCSVLPISVPEASV